jgi:hypothetical protein
VRWQRRVTAGETDTPVVSKRSRRLKNLGGAALTLLLDVLLVDAAVETYASGSSVRWWVVALVALYLIVTVWLMGQRVPFGRGPGWFTLPATPLGVLLVALALSTNSADGLTHGIRLLRQPTSAVFAGATLLVALLAAFCLVRPRGGRWWWLLSRRAFIGGLAVYVAVGFVLAIRGGTPYTDLLQHGRGFWQRLPLWLQGPFVGALVLIPMALALEIGLALAHLVIRGRKALIVLFALGLWVAWLGASVGSN